jgi:hypothetical protein
MNSGSRIDAALVEEWVLKSHGDFERVKELLDQQPALINAAWDWGSGDWETGLGAAAHVGRRDIAEHLLARGARLDVFAAAMLGHLELVQGILRANPAAATSLGPHGISLLQHAIAGGDVAKQVADFLHSQA